MPIYEFGCPKCRKVYSFLSKRLKQERDPVCPKCGCSKLERQMSTFAMPRGLNEAASLPSDDSDASEALPDFEDPRVSRVMNDIERDMAHLDENNPKHMAHMMRKLKEIMPQGTIPKEMDVAIKRLESGEDPEKIEADMGDVFGAKEDGEGDGGMGAGGSQPYSKDSGLYDY